MFRRSFDSVLSDCIDAMHRGATVDDCLARYPRQAKKLAPELAMAAQVARTPLAKASPAAQDDAWRALQKRAGELRSGRVRPRAVTGQRGSLAWAKPAAFAAVLVLSVSAAGGGVMYAAQDAQPDSTLYSVKLAGEDVHVWLTFNDGSKANILLDQSEQRMEEINAAVREGKTVPENALSAMNSRNQRAAEILAGQPENTALRARLLSVAKQQEDRLLAIWTQVAPGGRETYADVVANLHNIQLDGGAGAAQVSLRPEELSGGILTITGQAELGEDGKWRIGGVEVNIDERTLDHNQLQSGAGVSVLAARSSNGRLHALTANVQTAVVPTALVSGSVEKITDEGITVSGQFIPFSENTVPLAPLKVGERVQVTLHSTADGLFAGSISQFAATQSDDETIWFEGTVQGDISKATSQWTVSGMQFQITASTAFDARAGSAQDGARVEIEAVNKNGALQARRVMVLASQAAGDSATILGTFDGYDAEAQVWHVSGIPVVPPDNAQPQDDPAIGSLVVVETRRQGSDLVAGTIKVVQNPNGPQLVQLEGTIGAIDGSRWTLEIGQVRVASTAEVIPSGARPEVGKRVIVWVTQGRDGSLDATFARVLDQSPVVTPAPAITPTPAPPTP